MLRMEYEKEVILSIRHRIETYEQQRLFDDNAIDKDYTPLEVTLETSHIHLGSRQRGLMLLSYEKDLEGTLGFHGFGVALARFLHDYALVEVYSKDFVGDGFTGHQHYIYWYKVMFALTGPTH